MKLLIFSFQIGDWLDLIHLSFVVCVTNTLEPIESQTKNAIFVPRGLPRL